MSAIKPEPPTLGRIVYFVLPDGKRAEETRAAMVTNTCGGMLCNGTVFLDKANDEGSKDFFCSAAYDGSENPAVGTWSHGPRT